MLLKPWAATFWMSSWVMRGLPHAVSSAPTESSELPRFQPGCIAATVSMAFAPPVGGGVVVGSVGWPVPPLHTTPLRVNSAGSALAPDQDPLKPKETVASVAILAL